ALPQSPQLFKQILMVAGYDRYYQIVKCFRDEDLRADRQPEFTHIVIETSFLSEREIQDIMEGLVRHVWKRVLDVDLPPFQRLTYGEATSRIGSDKPDLPVSLERTGAKAGDLLFFGADRRKVVNDALGALRNKVGHEKGHADERTWKPCWVVDFPAFEYDDENKRWNSAHHPFTSPKDEHVQYLGSDPSKVLAKAYDIALNGWELGGGSVRIHRAEVQAKQFAALGIDAEEQRAKFGWLLDA